MLFNSYEFIFLFLPVVIAGFWLLLPVGRGAVLAWLVAASLFYYGWWNPPYVALLVGSVVANFLLGNRIARTRSRWLLGLGVAGNLGLLGYYKYLGFFAGIAASLSGQPVEVGAVILPLGISFFTFQQIAYLVDSRRGRTVPHGFLEYALFVTFFPQLIAGPIVHQAEMLPQFRDRRWALTLSSLNVGLTFFAVGLFKKVVIADRLALQATPVFDAAAQGESISFFEAWGATLAYTFQIYFDFSGYCDMAIGIGRMFGVRLPLNFASPYRATSVIDFWRCWHMTLSRFLRDYLYLPLGGNRHGSLRRYGNLMIVMLLGGLWHGANWTFVAWGGLHGLYLMINHGFRRLRREIGLVAEPLALRALAWLVTFVAVVVAWVFFRAANWTAALEMVQAMAGLQGSFRVPEPVVAWLNLQPALIEALGGSIAPLENLPYLAGREEWALLGLLLVAVLVLPNTQTWLQDYRPALEPRQVEAERLARSLRWSMSWHWAVATSGFLILAILSLSNVSEFLYYQF